MTQALEQEGVRGGGGAGETGSIRKADSEWISISGSGSSLAAIGKRLFRLRKMNEHAAQLITLLA